MPKLILASSSPRRLQLLTQSGLKPDLVISPDVDESVLKQEAPKDYVKRIAHLKAKVIAASHSDAVVVACDTIVALGARILCKPVDAEDATKMLNRLSGRRHRVYSCVVVGQEGKFRSKIVSTVVQFKKLSKTEIDFHTSSLEWEGKSGGYSSQGLSGCYIKKINGSISNVIGLPMVETLNLLKSFSIEQKLL